MSDYSLTHHLSRSCGCWHYDEVRTHGASHHGPEHYLYMAWKNLRARCASKRWWRYYGGRGITVDPRWQRFETFRADILGALGHRPSPKHSIDRINNDGHYAPGNVRWATPHEQMLNSRAKQARGAR